jgi:hypothetical protein
MRRSFIVLTFTCATRVPRINEQRLGKEFVMAAHHAVLFGWNRVVPGSEAKAIALFGEALQFWGQQQQAGAIESFEPVLLTPHGGDLNGFILVRGEADQLNHVLASEAYLVLETKANLYLAGYGVISAVCGEAIEQRMALYQQVIAA